ncbi:hypothetical protein EGI22_20730 [Lacihabitans sp. LS3-19]|nr:hypothetical protein [Lacihabitans sp. LS3-19]
MKRKLVIKLATKEGRKLMCVANIASSGFWALIFRFSKIQYPLIITKICKIISIQPFLGSRRATNTEKSIIKNNDKYTELEKCIINTRIVENKRQSKKF